MLANKILSDTLAIKSYPSFYIINAKGEVLKSIEGYSENLYEILVAELNTALK